MESLNPRHFLARGEVRQGDLAIPVTITGTHPVDRAIPVACILAFDEPSLPSGWYALALTPNDLQIRGITSEGNELWIPSFNIISSSHHMKSHERYIWNIETDILFEGDLSEFDAPEGYVHISFLIPETPLLIERAAFLPEPDGSITRQGESSSMVQWSISSYTFQATESFSHIHVEKPTPDTVIRQRNYSIDVSFPISGLISLANLLKNIEKFLEDSLLLLSFLSRKRLDWYSAKIFFIPTTSREKPRSAKIARYAWLGFEHNDRQRLSWLDVPVNYEMIRTGLFQELITNYLNSEYYHTIRQIIPSLLSSYERGYFEALLGMLYSALEGLVDRASEVENISYLLGSSQFEKLSKKIRHLIRNQLGENNTTNRVIEKLSELRRRSFVDKLSLLIENNHIDPVKLWTWQEQLPQVIRELVKRRNLFIHQGKIDDYNLYGKDYYRMQVLLELWILHLLQCPNDAINQHAYDTQPVNP